MYKLLSVCLVYLFTLSFSYQAFAVTRTSSSRTSSSRSRSATGKNTSSSSRSRSATGKNTSSSRSRSATGRNIRTRSATANNLRVMNASSGTSTTSSNTTVISSSGVCPVETPIKKVVDDNGNTTFYSAKNATCTEPDNVIGTSDITGFDRPSWVAGKHLWIFRCNTGFVKSNDEKPTCIRG